MAVIAIPISLQSMITIGVNMTDTVMVGKLGETSLSATALANQFVNIYQICCMGIAMGASVLTSRFWGMQDITSLKKTITLMLRLCIVLAVLFMLPTILIAQLLMRLNTIESTVFITACSWYFSGSNGYGKNRNGICIGKFNNSCYTAAYDRDNSGNLSRQLHYDRSHIGPR